MKDIIAREIKKLRIEIEIFFEKDEVGLESYQRVSRGIGLELVDAAREMSYNKASRIVTGSLVTKQTVMRKLLEAAPAVAPVMRKKIAVLHVDADEDHVKLQTGDSRIVPLVSVYEGIERNGKRGIYKNRLDHTAWH